MKFVKKHLLALSLVWVVAPFVSAGTTYNFEQAGTGTILATLDLIGLPATEAQVVQLTFTPAGDAILGYGGTYSGTFDISSGAFVDDGFGGLQGTLVSGSILYASITDNDPPSSTQFAGPFRYFELQVDSRPETDAMILLPPEVASPLVQERGDWREVVVPEPAIPEPGTLALLGLGGLALLRRRRGHGG